MKTDLAVIDMAPYIEGSEKGRDQVAKEIYHAAHNIGFLYLKNFGMSTDMLETAFGTAYSLFNSKEKLNVAYNSEINHGFTSIKGEALDPSKPADLKETFTSRNLANIPSGPEFWPNPQFEAFMRDFYSRVRKIASDVMGAFALALDLPNGFFDSKHTGITQTLRLLHYPPIKHVSDGQLGAGAHTDYGTLTVLFQDSAGGLQVKGIDGKWVDAPPIPGTAIINTGDLISRWSNDFFKSTSHRVIPRSSAMKKGRLSIAFFSDPDPEVVIKTFPKCITTNNPLKYDTITAGEHIHKRIMASQAKH